MTTIERLRATVLEELIEGGITAYVAAIRLNISVRQVKRLKKRMKSGGCSDLIHQSRGVRGTRLTEGKVEQTIVQIIKKNYSDFGPTLAWEKLHEFHAITLGKETIRQIMIRNNIWKSTKRRRGQYFAWRDRRASYGELQQFDGSYHDWFEGRNPLLPEACLLASIDDATGRITRAEFADNEGVEAVFRFWWGYIKDHGIPTSIYLDKFSTYKINHKAAVDNHDLMTQFGRATKELGIELISANTPQAKGRVERLFGTLQDRLVKEMRLANIDTIETANTYLKDIFIPFFNKRFAVIPKSETTSHRRLDRLTKIKLKNIFAKHHTRKIHNDFTIQFKQLFYQLKEIQPTTVFKRDSVLLIERLDGRIKIEYKGTFLNYIVLPVRPVKGIALPAVLTEHRLNWIPPQNHPWRQYR
ncbi:ISNCY family transposase [Deltaproteobacteria bacterium TL4]